MPANVPTGSRGIDAQLFAGGAAAARTQTALEVMKAGFELPRRRGGTRPWPALRPVRRSLMALTIGWFGSVIFRRD